MLRVARELPETSVNSRNSVIKQGLNNLVAGLSRQRQGAFNQYINENLEHVKRYFISSYIIRSAATFYGGPLFSGSPSVARIERNKEGPLERVGPFLVEIVKYPQKHSGHIGYNTERQGVRAQNSGHKHPDVTGIETGRRNENNNVTDVTAITPESPKTEEGAETKTANKGHLFGGFE